MVLGAVLRIADRQSHVPNLVEDVMRTTLCLLLGILAACGGGSGGTTGPTPTGGGTFRATIDGSSWVSTQNQTTGGGSGSNQVPGVITMTGTQVVSATNYTSVTITLGYISGPGTYPLGVNAGTTAGGTAGVIATQGTALGTWNTNLTGNGGTITVSSLTSSRIAGTFSFTAPPMNFTTTTGTRVVTNGQFDLPLPSNFVAAPSTNSGSTFSALVNGTAWNAATVVALGSGGSMVVGGTADTLSMSIAPATVMSPGNSYPIGGTGGATMIVIRSGTSKSWTSPTSGAAAGSITLSALANGRASGTFTATLQPSAGTTGTLVITQGAFNVRVDSP